MVVVNGAQKGATRTTMFGQPSYPGYSGAEGVAHAQPPASSDSGFSVAAAQAAGYKVTPSSSAPGGYILSTGGQQLNIYGNPISSSSTPITGTASLPAGYSTPGSTTTSSSSPSSSNSSNSGAPNYSASQLAAMYNQANALSTNPQPIHYSSSGGMLTTNAPSSSGTPSASSNPTITNNPSGTGANQIPSSIQSELQSGKISSYYNPNTGQTFYAPHTIGNSGEWLSGPGYSGPVQSYNGNLYINKGGNIIPVTTTSTTEITNDGKVLYHGSTANAPHIEYADGKFTGLLNIPKTSSPAAEFTNYQTLPTSNGSVSLPESIQDGSIIETGKWAQSASGAFAVEP